MSEKPEAKDVIASRQALFKELKAVELVCSGTLLKRTKVCGKPTCRCATDPKARHGPYYEWSQLQDGRLVHKVVSPEQAKTIIKAIRDLRRLRRKLRRWEAKSRKVILGEKRRKR